MVLPLLENELVATGWISLQDYLTGIALVQALPGPLFNISAYLGEQSLSPKSLNPKFPKAPSSSKRRIVLYADDKSNDLHVMLKHGAAPLIPES